MRFANLLLLPALVAGYTYIPPKHRVETGATAYIPRAECHTFNECHECVLAGCSPVTYGDRVFQTCASPGAPNHDGTSRPHDRPGYVELFERAKKCKDTKKICHSQITKQDGKGDLYDAALGFKIVAKGSSEDIEIPTNYFCLVDFKSSEYSYMKVFQEIGTTLPGVAVFFRLEYFDSKGLVTLYNNWQQFQIEKNLQVPIRTLNSLGQYFVGGKDQSTSQQMIFWAREKGQMLSDAQFHVTFTGVTPTEYLAATAVSKYMIYIIIAVVVCCCVCICCIIAKNQGGGSGGNGGGFIFFGGGGYGDGGGGGGGFGDGGGGGGGCYGDGGGGGGY